MIVKQALSAGTARLVQAGVDGAARDARRLMAACLRVDAARLVLHMDDPLPNAIDAQFAQAVARRAAGVPVSHILGWRDFYGRRFSVSPDVLDPRPETETLIQAALQAPFDRVLDLGTGSGCILLTLLAERPSARGIGTDRSKAALDVARQNAETLGLAARCDFLPSDWWQRVSGRFDLIVSNPPYIALDEMADLAPELSFEPRMALTDEGDGLGAYRAICAGVMAHLVPGGRLLVEIGHRQGPDVAALFAKAGLTELRVLPDLDGRDRVVTGQNPE